MSGLVHATITGEAPSEPRIAAPVRWLYDPADPYAVSVDLTELTRVGNQAHGIAGDDDPRVWTFGRYLLAEGLHDGPSGEGDVRVSQIGPWLLIRLAVDDESCTVRFSSSAVDRFVRQTRREVRLGGESKRMAAAIDDACARLLGGVS